MSNPNCEGVPSFDQVITNIYRDQETLTSNGRSQYQNALEELKQGKKISHWMWFIFPSLCLERRHTRPDLLLKKFQDLGIFINFDLISYIEQNYDYNIQIGIMNILYQRFQECTMAVLQHLRKGKTVLEIFDHFIDATKFFSTMTHALLLNRFYQELNKQNGKDMNIRIPILKDNPLFEEVLFHHGQNLFQPMVEVCKNLLNSQHVNVDIFYPPLKPNNAPSPTPLTTFTSYPSFSPTSYQFTPIQHKSPIHRKSPIRRRKSTIRRRKSSRSKSIRRKSKSPRRKSPRRKSPIRRKLIRRM